jgi:hypothetical protein
MDRSLESIREGIACGKLPGVDCVVAWYGPGRGQHCAVCDRRILGVELGVNCDLPDGRTVSFHAQCYAMWRAVLGA